MKLTGAQALIKSLEMQGVEVMFGLPGGAILPVYDPIIDSSIRHILVRHEQGAARQAEHDLDPLHLEALYEGLGPSQLHMTSPVPDRSGN